MNEEEYYTITTNQIGNLLVYGGKSDIIYISEFPTLQLKQKIDDFSDSIIFLRFIQDDTLLAVTYDGVLCMYVLENNNFIEVNRVDIEEDITKIDFFGEFLVLGTSKGTIHIFEKDLGNDVLLQEHNTEIQDLVFSNRKLFTLSQNKLICYDMDTLELDYEHMLSNCVTMCVDNKNEYVMISTEYETLLIRDNVLIKKYGYGSESIIFANGMFIAGGSGYNLNVFSLSDFENKQIQFTAENIEGISKIVCLQGSIVAFSTFCGKIMVGDINIPRSFRIFDGGVGIIFDFRFYYRNILICGSNGINIIDL